MLKALGEVGVACGAIMSLPSCTTMQYTPATLQVSAENHLEPINEETILWRKKLMVNGVLKECTLFLVDELRLRIENHEYAVRGTPMYVPIPYTSKSIEVLIPFSPERMQSASGNFRIDAEEGMVGISIDIPNLMKGELIVDESTLPKSLSNFESTNDGNLVVDVRSGNFDIRIENENMPCVLHSMKYDRTKGILRLQEVEPERCD